MKKLIFKSLAAGIVVANLVFLFPHQAFSEEKDPLPLKCKVEVIDCPGWGTGNRQVCHEHGSGLDCNPCGASTTCPEGGNT